MLSVEQDIKKMSDARYIVNFRKSLLSPSLAFIEKLLGNCKFLLHLTLEACRRAGIVVVSAKQLKPIEKLMLKLTTKSQIEFGQARY